MTGRVAIAVRDLRIAITQAAELCCALEAAELYEELSSWCAEAAARARAAADEDRADEDDEKAGDLWGV